MINSVLPAEAQPRPVRPTELHRCSYSPDPETGEQGPREVIDSIIGYGAKELVEITINGKVVVATDQHPFWVDDEGRWVDAGDLEAGEILLLADGNTASIEAVYQRTEIRRVHNLVVDGIHTYHVLVGSAPVLVHNCTPLTKGEKELLGGLSSKADSKASDILRERGGGAKNIRGAGLQDDMGEWTLRELAHEAKQGNRQAERWVKMIKQAGSQGKGGK